MADLQESWLDRPTTVEHLADRAKCSTSKVRRWLNSLGERVSCGFTRPRTYWLPEEEKKRELAEGTATTQVISATHRAASIYRTT